jgi:hypothetical protein
MMLNHLSFSTYPKLLGSLCAFWIMSLFLPTIAAAQNNLNYYGGATLQGPITVYIIQWLPPGIVADSARLLLPDADNRFSFEPLYQLSGSAYLNIATQYYENCGSSQCALSNRPGAVQIHEVVDTRPYPHAGTTADPLQDSDIQVEITQAIIQNAFPVDVNTVFFVVTGVIKNTGQPVQECNPGLLSCTFGGSLGFCAYHTSFNLNGVALPYAYLSDASFSVLGCNEGIFTPLGPSNSLVDDREVALFSHELMEAITDPFFGSAWIDKSTNNEIGDNCNQAPSKVDIGWYTIQLQQEWSNATSSCVSSLPTVTKVSPSSGPNIGGNRVEVDGAPFNTTGATTISFGGNPASPVTCPTSTQCFTVAPNEGVATSVTMTATVNGISSNRWDNLNYTYLGGPACTTNITCTGRAFGFPGLDVQCTSPANFYDLFGTPNVEFLASGVSYDFDMNDTQNTAAACAPGGSCTSFSLYEASATYCGALPPQPPNFCKECRATGGICTTGPGGRKFCVHE